MLPTAALEYDLPADLIAQHPITPRDAARLLVVSRSNPDMLEHRVFSELPEILKASLPTTPPLPGAIGDLLVVNSTRVLPARFAGVRSDTLGKVEGLFLRVIPSDSLSDGVLARWQVLLKMRRARIGSTVLLHTPEGQESAYALTLVASAREDGVTSDTDAGGWIVEVSSTTRDTPADSRTILDEIGLTPLPPYILAARRHEHVTIAEAVDKAEYQTVYAQPIDTVAQGSVAAPTAGLHFTPDLLRTLTDQGVQREEVWLDVGMGTFKPIETEFVEQHPMHSELCGVPTTTIEAIAARKNSERGRIFAVGTTSTRTLESFETIDQMRSQSIHETRLLITPGYHFKHIDGLITNFHLPRSTLLAMVAAMLTPVSKLQTQPDLGLQRLKSIYAQAIERRYRFYSYGDAMIILP